MKLRYKTLGFIGIILICMIFVQYEVSHIILGGSFTRLEDQYIQTNVEIAINSIQEDTNKLDNIVKDWATWDDTYSFIDQLNDNYKRSNVIDVTFKNLKINLMLFINSNGRIVYGKAFDDKGNEKSVPKELTGLSGNDSLMKHNDTESFVSGIIMLPEGPMLVSSRPILTSKSKGPIRGTLVMGRFLDQAEIERFTEIIHRPLSIYRFDDPRMPSDFSEARISLFKNKTLYVKPLTEESIAGYKVLNDIYGNPAIILRVDSSREFYRQGQATMWYFIESILAIGIVFGVVTIFFLERSVLSPLSGLSNNVSRIEKSGDLSERVMIKKKENDELGNLADGINGMLGSLEQSTEKLRMSEEKNKAFINAIPDVMFQLGKDGTILNIKATKSNFFNIPQGELPGKKFYEVMSPDLASKTSSCIYKALMTGQMQIIEFQYMQDAIMHNYEARYISSGKDEILAIIRDITERKQAEEAKKNELLLKEIHHRVKNNLQVISSLLYLQSKKINDEVIVAMLKESQDRVKSMAIAHEKLYMSSEMGKIDIREYIRDITTSLFQSYELYSNSVKLSLDVDKVLLDIDTAIPCGLIINELVTNSLKHAFPNGTNGKIFIEFHMENNRYKLVVGDNGKGLPIDFDIQKTETLGLKLITTLIEQINGIFDLNRIGGTVFTIIIKSEKS
jgi:PAS domain S-box-containing protein